MSRSDSTPRKGNVPPDRSRLFYSGAAILLLALMFLGFQQFYLHGRAYPDRELAPPIRTLIIVHGIGMTLWMLLFAVQPLLIATGNRRFHMLLGKFGAVLAVSITILGYRLAIESTLVSPPEIRIWGLSPREFLAVPVVNILSFAAFATVGVGNRRRLEAHRPMMLLATLAVASAAISRIGPISEFYAGTVWESVFGPFFGMLVLGMLLLVANSFLEKATNRWFAVGYAALFISSALTVQVAKSWVWDQIASILLS